MSEFVGDLEPLVSCLRVYPQDASIGRDPYVMSGSILYHNRSEVEIKGVTSRGDSRSKLDSMRKQLITLAALLGSEINDSARALLLSLIDSLELELVDASDDESTNFVKYREAISTALYRSGVDIMQWTRKRTDGRPDKPVRLPTKRWARAKSR